MTKISRVELFHVAIPLPATFYPSWIPGFPQTENRFDLIRVTTNDGVQGVSAGAAMGTEREGLGSLIGPYLIGEDPTDIPTMQQRLREMSYLGWSNYWIEPAFWDIKGKLESRPVCELLGGSPTTIQLYASTGQVRSANERVREVMARSEEGFETVKIRVHEDESSDIDQLLGTIEGVDDEARIAVDANQGWRVAAIADAPRWDLARAKRFADVCADLNVAWIEEPLAMDAYEDLAELTAYSDVPITGGELQTAGESVLKMMVDKKCYDVFQPDATFTGGIAQTARIADRCHEQNLSFSPHTWTNGIGFAVNLQVMAGSTFATSKELEYPYDPPAWVPEARDGVLSQPFYHDQGQIDVPDKPGLGIEIDERALNRFGERFFVMDKLRLAWHGLKDRGFRVAREIDATRQKRREDRIG